MPDVFILHDLPLHLGTCRVRKGGGKRGEYCGALEQSPGYNFRDDELKCELAWQPDGNRSSVLAVVNGTTEEP